MGKERARLYRRWWAFSAAGAAAAVFVGKAVRVGDVDLAADYRSQKLQEIAKVLDLDGDTHLIPSSAALILNWSLLSRRKIGAPADLFEPEEMVDTIVELDYEADRYGERLMERNWLQIFMLAEALLDKGRLSESEVVQILRPTQRVEPLRDIVSEAARQLMRTPTLH